MIPNITDTNNGSNSATVISSEHKLKNFEITINIDLETFYLNENKCKFYPWQLFVEKEKKKTRKQEAK